MLTLIAVAGGTMGLLLGASMSRLIASFAGLGSSCISATGAVLLWAPREELTYDTFAAAIGFLMSVILPTPVFGAFV